MLSVGCSRFGVELFKLCRCSCGGSAVGTQKRSSAIGNQKSRKQVVFPMLPGSAAGQSCRVRICTVLWWWRPSCCAVLCEAEGVGCAVLETCNTKKGKRATGILFLQAGKAKAIRRAGRQRAKVMTATAAVCFQEAYVSIGLGCVTQSEEAAAGRPFLSDDWRVRHGSCAECVCTLTSLSVQAASIWKEASHSQ